MQPNFRVIAVCGWALVCFLGCGRDALLTPEPMATLKCQQPSSNRFELGQMSPVSQCAASVELLPGAALDMAMMVRLILGRDDAATTKELSDAGLNASLPEDRAKIIEKFFTVEAARALADQWMSSWLQIPEKSPFPERFSTALWADLREETLRAGRSVFIERTDPLATLVASRESFMNDVVARHYNLPAPPPGTFVRTTMQPPRVGVLGHASVLGSHPSVSSRGELLLKSMLQCQSVPFPPQGVGAHDVPQVKLVSRANLQATFVNPVCQGCHRLMDAGFALHSFDERGLFRDRQSDGTAVDARATVMTLSGDETSVTGLLGLAEFLQKENTWKNCLAQSLLDLVATRMRVTINSDDQTTCGPAVSVAQGWEKSQALPQTLRLIADMVFQQPPPPAARPPADPPVSPTELGKLSACTSVDSQDITCSSVCGQQGKACTQQTCRLGGTLGTAFLFSNQSDCKASNFVAVQQDVCGAALAALACSTSETLKWVSCCCD